MAEYPMLIALKRCESYTDATFELAETKDEIVKRIRQSEQDEVEQNEAIAADESDKVEESESTEEAGVTSGTAIKTLLDDYVGKISSYHALSNVIMFMPRLLSGAQLKAIFYDNVDNFAKIDEVDGYDVYGLRPDQIGELNNQLARLTELFRGLSVLPESVLLSLVATFDSYIASIALGLLKSQPGRYDDDKKMVSVKRILSMTSFDEVVSMLAEAEVEDCMRGSHTSQIAFLETLADVKIREHYERWPSFVEIFERRNLVAHQKTRANSVYIANCLSAGIDVSHIKVGDTLKLDYDYLKSSVNLLLEFGVLLLFVIWRKKFKSEGDEAFSALNRKAFELIQLKYVTAASRILEFAIFKQNRKAQDITIKMMIVNLANCYKKLGEKDKMEQVLSSAYLSSASDQFKISIAAVLDDVDQVVSLMPRVTDDLVVGADGFRTWPVFDSIRNDSKFVEAFEKVFNQPLGAAFVKDAEAKRETKLLQQDPQEPDADQLGAPSPSTIH